MSFENKFNSNSIESPNKLLEAWLESFCSINEYLETYGTPVYTRAENDEFEWAKEIVKLCVQNLITLAISENLEVGELIVIMKNNQIHAQGIEENIRDTIIKEKVDSLTKYVQNLNKENIQMEARQILHNYSMYLSIQKSKTR